MDESLSGGCPLKKAWPWAGHLPLAQVLPKEADSWGSSSSIPTMWGNTPFFQERGSRMGCITVHRKQLSLFSTHIWDLPLPFTCLYKKHFSSFRNIFPIPSFPFGPWHPRIWSKCRVRDSICSEMYSFLLSSSFLFLTSLPQLSSGKFTCFQFELHDSQPWWQAKCHPISSSLEFFYYSLGGHILPLCSLPIPCAWIPRTLVQPTGCWTGAWVSSAISLWDFDQGLFSRLAL